MSFYAKKRDYSRGLAGPGSRLSLKMMRFSRKRPRNGISFIPLVAFLFTGVIFAGSVFKALSSQTSPYKTPRIDDEVIHLLPTLTERPEVQAEVRPLEPAKRITVTVKKGDTLSAIFSRLDVHSELAKILNLHQDTRRLERIYPGQKLHFTLRSNRIDELQFEFSRTNLLKLYRDQDSFAVEELNHQPVRILQPASGSISSSLFLAGRDAGLSDKLIMDLAQIFGWDIDFALDIREGDSFTVLYEKLFLDGEAVGNGDIVAAEFVNNGTSYRAYRYTDAGNGTEYYSQDGNSMRKSFLRTPVHLGSVSSRFSARRLHPVLNIFRPHKGVDYAAATGTPIMASGTGKVVYRGTKGQYGKTIILRHGNIYTTLYAHMSRYARGTGVGRLVQQGQVIGYVGRTGLATGPHLHYEFRVNGVHRDPLKVKLPSTNPLPESQRERFRTSIQPLVTQLDVYRQHRLAMQDL